MIQLDHTSKVYRGPHGEVRALDDVALTVQGGEFVVVRGPSGSGKSTLLLTIGGMIRPTDGRVVVDGTDVYALSGKDRARFRAHQIGFVFQMFHLVPYLTVIDNVLLPTRNAPDKRQSRERGMALLERFGMSDRLRHRPAALSAGERQRTALARALVNQPKLLLADEPTGNLDPDNAAEVLRCLAAFTGEGGTVVLVTHARLDEGDGRRRVVLERGRIVDGATA